MKINLKQPRYVIPLLALPFLCLFFYVYNSSLGNKNAIPEQPGMNSSVAEISDQVKKRGLTDKLDAYRDRYRESEGVTAINNIDGEVPESIAWSTGKQKESLDSIDRLLRDRGSASRNQVNNRSIAFGKEDYPRTALSSQDRAMAEALANLGKPKLPIASKEINQQGGAVEKDPMEVFKKQMAYMDSMGKANDPEYQAELKKKEKLKIASSNSDRNVQPVSKQHISEGIFNTVLAEMENGFISALIDENVKGYAGSRIRIRILHDIFVGELPLKKGTYLFAEISGFSQQRVKLSISSIAREGIIIPVKLEIYDLDGLEGLYVPSSNFREFSRNLGTESVQGFSTQGTSQNQQEFLMSAVDKIFTSTSSAISGLIRKNKAKVKYNSHIYLIDTSSLRKQTK